MKTPISYYGGKQRLAKRIISLFPVHRCYVEPFFGGGAVYWYKQPSEVEVINDIDQRVITFFQVLQDRAKYKKLKLLLDKTLHSRYLHNEAGRILKNVDMSDEIEIAWAFYVQTNMSFGKCLFKGFGYGHTRSHASTVTNNIKNLKAIYCDRLINTTIENKDALEVIKAWDSNETLFYCDPPYINTNMGHYKGYTEEDYRGLLDTLTARKGRFVLSSSPSAILKEYLEKTGWEQTEIKQPLAVCGKRKERKYKVECLIANYMSSNREKSYD